MSNKILIQKTLNDLKIKKRILYTLTAYYTVNYEVLEDKENLDLAEQISCISNEIYCLTEKIINELEKTDI